MLLMKGIKNVYSRLENFVHTGTVHDLLSICIIRCQTQSFSITFKLFSSRLAEKVIQAIYHCQSFRISASMEFLNVLTVVIMLLTVVEVINDTVSEFNKKFIKIFIL